MTWNENVPAGTDLISDGDNVIRELKADLNDALNEEGVFPGADTANPVFKWTGKRGNTAGRPSPPSTGELYFNTELFQLEYYSGSAWTGYDLVPLLAITTSKINDLAVTTGKINTLAVTTAKIDDLSVTAGKIGALAVTDAKVNDVAATKITGTIATAQIANSAVDSDKIAASVAGNGLAGGAGSALSVNVDSSTIELNADALRVKALGITAGEIAALAVTNAKVNDVAATKITGTIVAAQIGALAVTDAKVNDVAATKITGTLPIANGGTALTTYLLKLVNYTGNGVGGSGQAITHGMGSTPDMILILGTGITDHALYINGLGTGVTSVGATTFNAIGNTAGTGFNVSAVAYKAICFKAQA